MGKKTGATQPRQSTAQPKQQGIARGEPNPNARDEGGGEGGVRTGVAVVHGIGGSILNIFGVPKQTTDQLGELEQQAVTAGFDRSRE